MKFTFGKPTYNKYGNKKVTVKKEDGTVEKFDSIQESELSIVLESLLKEGKIKSLEKQKVYILQDKFRCDCEYSDKELLPVKIGNKQYEHFMVHEKNVAIGAIKYKADFVIITLDDKELVIDAKGQETTDFKIKRKMFQNRYNKDIITVSVQITKHPEILLSYFKEQGYIN